MTQTISTPDLAKQMGNPGFSVIDARPMAAYNGWPLLGEARGGHIPGAVALPLSWTDDIEDVNLKTLLRTKGLTAEETVVLCGYSRDNIIAMGDRLTDLGYENVRTYQAGMETWAADNNLPMTRLTRYETLVHPEWIHRLIKGEHAESYPDNGFAIFHVNFGVSEEYAAGHIPRAMHLDTNALEPSTSWNRRSAKELEAALLAHGITHQKTIVLYGRHSSPDTRDAHPGQSAGHIAAARAAAILMYAGVEDVRLLDGGIDAWVSAGYTLERDLRKPTPVAAFGAQIPNRPDFIIDMDAAKALLADPNGVLVSIRSWPEFSSEASGYHYITVKGRIPGAVWGDPGSDAYHMEKYRNVDNTMRCYPEIEAKWRDAGITPEKRAAFFCGTGWRASETFFYAHIMGWEQVAVYIGGWLEWSSDENNPIERGAP